MHMFEIEKETMAATEQSKEETKSTVLSELSTSPSSLQACFALRKPKLKGKSPSEAVDLGPASDTVSLSSYSQWKEAQGIPLSTKIYTVVSGQYPDIHLALQRRGKESARLSGKQQGRNRLLRL